MSCLRSDDWALLLSEEPPTLLKARDIKPFLSDIEITLTTRTDHDYAARRAYAGVGDQAAVNWGSRPPATEAAAVAATRARCLRVLTGTVLTGTGVWGETVIGVCILGP